MNGIDERIALLNDQCKCMTKQICLMNDELALLKKYNEICDAKERIEKQLSDNFTKYEWYDLSDIGFSRYKTNGKVIMSKRGYIVKPKNFVISTQKMMYDLRNDEDKLIHVSIQDIFNVIK